MAWYKYSNTIDQKNMDEFDKIYSPGTLSAWSGIYRCQGCAKEIVHTTDHPLPPQNHHQHSAAQGSIRWRLIVTDSTS
jgi:hypothetical protein